MKKESKEFKRGFLKACALIRSIEHKDFDWHIKTFGNNGANAADYANWAKKKLK